MDEKPNDPLFVDDKLTPLTESEATYYLREAFRVVTGKYPNLDSLAILWAQSALETGRWKLLHFANWGNIKRIAGQKYTSYKCSEILNGKHKYFEPYHPQTFFAAWDSPLEGAIAYLNFLHKRARYAKSWEQIILGDPIQYSKELKKAGYYTANEDHYTKGVVRLTTEFKNKSKKLLSWAPLEEERRSQLPTIIPTGDASWLSPKFPEIDFEYHPTQEDPKPIKVPNHPIVEVLLSILKVIKDLW